MRRRYPIFKLADDVYVEWVSACGAPGFAYTRAEVEAILAEGISEAEQALELARGALGRLDSASGHTIADPYWAAIPVERMVAGNRAGPNESTLTFAELVAQARADLEPEGAPE